MYGLLLQLWLLVFLLLSNLHLVFSLIQVLLVSDAAHGGNAGVGYACPFRRFACGLALDVAIGRRIPGQDSLNLVVEDHVTLVCPDGQYCMSGVLDVFRDGYEKCALWPACGQKLALFLKDVFLAVPCTAAWVSPILQLSKQLLVGHRLDCPIDPVIQVNELLPARFCQFDNDGRSVSAATCSAIFLAELNMAQRCLDGISHRHEPSWRSLRKAYC